MVLTSRSRVTASLSDANAKLSELQAQCAAQTRAAHDSAEQRASLERSLAAAREQAETASTDRAKLAGELQRITAQLTETQTNAATLQASLRRSESTAQEQLKDAERRCSTALAQVCVCVSARTLFQQQHLLLGHPLPPPFNPIVFRSLFVFVPSPARRESKP